MAYGAPSRDFPIRPRGPFLVVEERFHRPALVLLLRIFFFGFDRFQEHFIDYVGKASVLVLRYLLELFPETLGRNERNRLSHIRIVTHRKLLFNIKNNLTISDNIISYNI